MYRVLPGAENTVKIPPKREKIDQEEPVFIQLFFRCFLAFSESCVSTQPSLQLQFRAKQTLGPTTRGESIFEGREHLPPCATRSSELQVAHGISRSVPRLEQDTPSEKENSS